MACFYVLQHKCLVIYPWEKYKMLSIDQLFNEQDKKAVESAASAANRNILSFLPILGEGEALIVGVDFPMPLIVKINAPTKKPDSRTPKLKKR